MKTHLSDDMAQVDLSEAKPKCSNLKPHFKTNSAVCGKVALCSSVLEFCFLTKSGAKTQGRHGEDQRSACKCLSSRLKKQ